MKGRIYEAIDLKSFYASVECVARGLNPLTTNLVVADISRTEKTICLAVSPSLKALKIKGRARLFEVVQSIREVNNERLKAIPDHIFHGKSSSAIELQNHPDWEIDYVVATPRMAEYIRISSKIYGIYLRYISHEDIHVYSIDEVFMDVTDYLRTYHKTPHELAMDIIHDVLKETGITATVGIGTNLYLAKVAMDIVAKHVPADKDGVRIAELDEMTYRHKLWNHTPITDFWRIGRGVADRLALYGVSTMGQLARFSLKHEEQLYELFGVNAEIIIDHAWGWEPCTIADVKAYKPEHKSIGQGQVLQHPYNFKKGLVVAKEMAESLSLELFDKHLVTDTLVLTISYDRESLCNKKACYHGPVSSDYYGRKVPKHAHGTIQIAQFTSSSRLIRNAIAELYGQIVAPFLLVRRLSITACNVMSEEEISKRYHAPLQLDLFTDYDTIERKSEKEKAEQDRDRRIQKAMLAIKKKYGKNYILKGLDFEEGATGKERNQQIGGHKS